MLSLFTGVNIYAQSSRPVDEFFYAPSMSETLIVESSITGDHPYWSVDPEQYLIGINASGASTITVTIKIETTLSDPDAECYSYVYDDYNYNYIEGGNYLNGEWSYGPVQTVTKTITIQNGSNLSFNLELYDSSNMATASAKYYISYTGN
ncbi:hypothetical protein ACFSKN_13160 [Mariniflexile gromovii]|uniref:Uncharacterized protein n=1 Tax=Mariniflexile gromovii TaxID=362523 RepID=A0ABS4BXQ4_9FLAO|nr:hypothetical protein [Mariniflexile gromovii]MBP0904812.1 hypothetical protein [Mariniflexile gromovii]